MAKQLCYADPVDFENIANSIRNKKGVADTYLPSEMSPAIDSISGGGGGQEIIYQEQTITPNESIQFATPDVGYNALSKVTVNAISSTYVGSGVPKKSSTDLTVNGATVIAPAGYYSTSASKSVASSTQAVPSVDIDSNGLITATSTQTTGYVSGGTKTATKQLTTKSAQTITPTKSVQTAVNANTYTLGEVKVGAIPSQYIIPSGSFSITSNDTYDISQYEEVVVNVQGGGDNLIRSDIDIQSVRVPDYYYTTGGVPTAYNGWDMSELIDVSGYDYIEYAGTDSWGNYNVFFLEDGVTKVGNNPTFNASSGKIQVPNGAKYLGISASSTNYLRGVFYGYKVAQLQDNVDATYTTNGQYSLTPDIGYNGMLKATINVDVPIPTFETEELTISPTESQQTRTPSKDGYSKVTVNAISSSYVGSAIPKVNGTTITPNNSSQTAISSGSYANGNITVSAVPTETKSIDSNGTYTPTSGKYFSSVSVDVPIPSFETEELEVTPTESQQTKTPTTDGYSKVTVNAISSTYVGSGISKYNDSGNTALTDTTTSKSYPAGYYSSAHGAIHSTVNIPDPTITVSSAGLITASANWTKGFTSDNTYSNTKQLTTKGTTSITPNSTTQTAISSGTYATGNITVAPVPTETKTVSQNGTVTPSSGKYLSSVTVSIPIQHYYTGTTMPSSSLGSDGDIYLYE